MFENARDGLAAILDQHDWIVSLAGILPLSALIDFIDIPPQLHFVQLAGAAPLWSWPITPAASRLLLPSDSGPSDSRICYLDRFGNSAALLGLDGYYGDRYYVSSPETTRLCIRSHSAYTVENAHENMKSDDGRLQNLEVIHVSRYHARRRPLLPWLRRISVVFPRVSSWRFLTWSAIGWVVWAAMIPMSVILETYISLAFLILMPMTGGVVMLLYGSNPRRLLVDNASPFNRLILVMEHENTMDWTIFYGESTIVNSLLNRPLEPVGPEKRAAQTIALRMILRVFVMGQWALALAAAATQNWNAYFICFWISLCIFVRAYIIPPRGEAKEWMKSYAGIRMERYRTVLSSRRALLNTIVALNPDTFALPHGAQKEDRTQLYEGAMRWIDPILKRGPSRTKWEQATMRAMNEAAAQDSAEDLGVKMMNRRSYPSQGWKQEYKDEYWSPFILEGIYMAAKIRERANLPGRMVCDVSE